MRKMTTKQNYITIGHRATLTVEMHRNRTTVVMVENEDGIKSEVIVVGGWW